MSEDKVKRFTGMQIAIHWGQGLLYITLLATGGAILFRRLTGIPTPPDSMLSAIHRGVGIGLMVDARRDLVWAMDNGQRMYVLKLTADALTQPKEKR